MSWRQGSLQELANPGSEFTWATFAFAGNDTLEAALEPGYFAWCADRLRPGDLILWGCNPDRSQPHPRGRAFHRRHHQQRPADRRRLAHGPPAAAGLGRGGVARRQAEPPGPGAGRAAVMDVSG
jgi:hypothetical protein